MIDRRGTSQNQDASSRIAERTATTHIEQQQKREFERRLSRSKPDTRAPWKQLRAVEGDSIAFRELILRREGWQTLHNVIRGDHGLPNAY